MAKLEADKLVQKYNQFAHPVAKLFVDDKEFEGYNSGFIVSDIEIDMTSGYEASVATLFIANGFDNEKSEFMSEKLSSVLPLGSVVRIAFGYDAELTGVFYGFVSKIEFTYKPNPENEYGMKVSLMDVKGLMMANNHSKQLKAKSYGEAVKEILAADAYSGDYFKKLVKGVEIENTPDKQEGGGNQEVTDSTIEIVAESDYEFIVKAARKFNFDFFTFAGKLAFWKAKSKADVLIELSPDSRLLRNLDIEYCISGLVSKVETRGMDTAKGEVISAEKKIKNKISYKNKTEALLKNSTKVYLDSTIKNKKDAEVRADSLVEDISYRFGSLYCEITGLPEMMPGFYVKFTKLGKGVNNTFYITRVRHKLGGSEHGYTTIIEGKAASLEE